MLINVTARMAVPIHIHRLLLRPIIALYIILVASRKALVSRTFHFVKEAFNAFSICIELSSSHKNIQTFHLAYARIVKRRLLSESFHRL